MGLFDSLLSSISTEVQDTYDRWLMMDTIVDPVPITVRFINHSIAPVVNIPMTATRYIKSFQGHQFAVGRSKK